jgi:hypothetical protein
VSLTFEQARDEMLTRFKTQWDADTPAVNGGTVPTVEFTNIEKLVAPVIGAAWARVAVQHSEGFQATLGETGGRRFSRTGFVSVSIYVPTASGLALLDRLSKIAQDAFEGKATPGGVWFRNVRFREGTPEGAWFQGAVLADFEYDQVK